MAGSSNGAIAIAKWSRLRPSRPRRRAAHRAQLAVDGDEIDQRIARAQLIEADFGLHALVGAAENFAVKGHHAVEIDDAKDHMVDRAKGEGRCVHRGRSSHVL